MKAEIEEMLAGMMDTGSRADDYMLVTGRKELKHLPSIQTSYGRLDVSFSPYVPNGETFIMRKVDVKHDNLI